MTLKFAIRVSLPEINLRPVLKSIRLVALYILYNYGIFLLAFLVWCFACYLYWDAITSSLLSTEQKHFVDHTPMVTRTVIVVIAGRRVSVKIAQKAKWLQVQMNGGNK